MKNLIYSTIFALTTTTVGLPIVAQAQDIEFDPSAASNKFKNLDG
jgi:hypothetical protein